MRPASSRLQTSPGTPGPSLEGRIDHPIEHLPPATCGADQGPFRDEAFGTRRAYATAASGDQGDFPFNFISFPLSLTPPVYAAPFSLAKRDAPEH